MLSERLTDRLCVMALRIKSEKTNVDPQISTQTCVSIQGQSVELAYGFYLSWKYSRKQLIGRKGGGSKIGKASGVFRETVKIWTCRPIGLKIKLLSLKKIISIPAATYTNEVWPPAKDYISKRLDIFHSDV